MAWRVAKSLFHLREQINSLAPDRNKRSDGTIGDAAHRRQGSNSDHNPWIADGGTGVVTALDITHDPENGCDCNQIVQSLINSRDSRIKYIIWQQRIISSVVQPWLWRPSSGHTSHLHLSVKSTKAHFDAQQDWLIDNIGSLFRTLQIVTPFMRGSDVRKVQEKLRELNYLTNDSDVDGIYGPDTETAVRNFQTDRGLRVDGIVGRRTYGALGID